MSEKINHLGMCQIIRESAPFEPAWSAIEDGPVLVYPRLLLREVKGPLLNTELKKVSVRLQIPAATPSMGIDLGEWSYVWDISGSYSKK